MKGLNFNSKSNCLLRIHKRLLKEIENSYRTTPKGLEFLRFYHGLRWLLWGKDLDYMLINIMNKLKKIDSCD